MSQRINKRVVLLYIKQYFYIVLGAFVLGFGVACFVTPLDLITGGISSVGIIVQYFVHRAGSDFQVVDIVAWVIQIIFLVISFIFLGKKYAMRTVVSSLLYPLFLSLMYRIPCFGYSSFGNMVASQFMSKGDTDWALMILASLSGGACIGAGVGLTYLGDGSTGGFDVISSILAKHTPIKEGLSSFMIDGTLVLIGIVLMRDIPKGIIGIIAAFICAAVVQFTYVNSNHYVICEVVSEKVEYLTNEVIEKLDRTTTIYHVIGGYSGEKKSLIRICVSKKQLSELKLILTQVDPDAFVTFVQAAAINGEGFDPLVNRFIWSEKKDDANGRE